MFDFGIGGGELLVVAVIALIVVGPKDLPKLLRTVGNMVSKMKGLAREFQNHLEEAAREAGVDEVKKEVDKMTNFTVTSDDIAKQEKELLDALEKPVGGSEKESEAAAPAEDAKPARAPVDIMPKGDPPPSEEPAKPAASKSAPARKTASKSATARKTASKPAKKTAKKAARKSPRTSEKPA